MKKISVLAAALLAVAFLFSAAGCSSVSEAITAATANTWYKYNGSSTATATATGSSTASTFETTYVYYDSSESKLKVVATSSASVASGYYIAYDKELSSDVWNAGAVMLKSKVTQQSSDPRSGKTQITSTADWGNIGTDAIVNLLLGQ